MTEKTQNRNLTQAKKNKKDEFYTQLSDIENELRHYKKHFKDKVIYCNCDDPRVSNFFHYFLLGFEHLGIKKLIATCYKNQNPDLFSQNNTERAIYLEYKRDEKGKLIPYPDFMKSISQVATYKGEPNNPNMPKPEDIGIGYLKGDGDFRSKESIEFLKEADIVVTNPPFSLLREYVAQLIEYDKKFVIIGSLNAITYKEIFKLIKENKLWLGSGFRGGNAFFKTPYPNEFAKGVYDEETDLVKFRNVTWFTNLDIYKRHEDLILWKTYNSEEYPTYDNYDAINVNKTKDIPIDYKGAMGVPITFMDKFNPEQFEIIGMAEDNGRGFSGGIWDGKNPHCVINGKNKFKRIFIKNKKI